MYNLRKEEKKLENDIINNEQNNEDNRNNEDENKLKKCFSHMINHWEFMSLQFLMYSMFTYNFFLYNLSDNLKLFYLYNIIAAIINLVVVNLFLLFITNNFTIPIYKDDFKKSVIFLLIVFLYFIISDVCVILYCKSHSDDDFKQSDITFISISISGKVLIDTILIYNLYKNTGEPIDFSEYFNNDDIVEELHRNILEDAIQVAKDENKEKEEDNANRYDNEAYGRCSTDAIEIDINTQKCKKRNSSIDDEIDNLFNQLNGSRYLPPILNENTNDDSNSNNNILIADEDSCSGDSNGDKYSGEEEYTVSNEVDDFFLNDDCLSVDDV